MTKVRVQDATKELSAGAGRLLESVSKTRRRALDVLQSLRKMEDNLNQQEAERKEQERKELLSKQQEVSMSYMNAYSSDDAPAQKPAEPAQEAARQEAPVVSAAPISAEPKAAEVKPVEKAAEAKPEAQPVEAKEKNEQPARQESAAPQERRGGEVKRPAAQAAQAPRQQQADHSGRPARAGQQGPYGRPVNPGQQGPYGRPVNPGQQGPYGRPVNPGQQGPYGRPVNPGQQGPYGRPVNPGQQGPYGRPVNPGQQGPYGRPVNPNNQGGGFNRPQGGRPGNQGGGFGRPQGGGSRPGGNAGGRGGMGFGRKLASELAPVVEKERVSNYDPNKKNYIRQNDPERVTRNRRMQARDTYNGLDDEVVRGGKRKKKNQQPQFHPEPVVIDKAYMTAETITVKDLTERIGKPAGEIIKKLMMLGIMATINNELDFDTAQLVCSEFGVTLEMKLAQTAEDELSGEDFEDKEEDLLPRWPVVTIMGHVDHGKTSLLDYIRKSRVTAGEAGGITQHIGAYTVDVGDKKITFLDTPGHEAFTAMRARGAQVTDIAVLVVAADDGVMPQTIEAINHAKAAKVPTIVAINKCDKPAANPERIKEQLTEYGLVSEEWGGDTIMVPLSALTGENVDQLLEMILLVAEVQDLKANPNRKARGTIVEAKLDKGRGPVATVLVQNGTLNVGDAIIAGTAYGRVRAMVNDRGERVEKAGPSEPVEVIGFNDVPNAGDIINAVDDDKLSRRVAEERKDKLRAALVKNTSTSTLDDLFSQISQGEVKDLNLIIKADVQGSVQAVRQSLEKLTNDEVRVHTVHAAAGNITESDVLLASVSGAIIIGFNVKMDANVSAIAERDKVEVRLYSVIYNAIEDVEKAMKGLLKPQYKEEALGRAEVRQVFKISGVGVVAGSYVLDGKVQRNALARLMRGGELIKEAKIESLKRFKDDAREVGVGYECGIGLEGFSDFKEGDIIECYLKKEIER